MVVFGAVNVGLMVVLGAVNVGLTVVLGAVIVGLIVVLGAVIVGLVVVFGAVIVGLMVVLGAVIVGLTGAVGVLNTGLAVVGEVDGSREPTEGRLPLAAGVVDCIGVLNNVLEVGELGVRKPFAPTLPPLAGEPLALGLDNGLRRIALRSTVFLAAFDVSLAPAAGFAAARERAAPVCGAGARALGTASRKVGILTILGTALEAAT